MASGHTRPAFTGAPHQYHRAARRLGAGWPIPQVARVLRCDPMDLHLLLREEPFAELFRAHDDLRSLAPEERVARLEEVALVLLEEAVEEGDLRVAWFVVRERRQGRNPASTLARGISEAAERDQRAARPYEAAPPPPPVRQAPTKPRPPADPGDRVAWRTAARLREGVMEEAAGGREEPPDILEEIEAEPEMSPAKKAHLRRVYLAMPEGP
jgi:hypothetical protein